MKKSDLSEWTIQPPIFSWDKPIEEEILAYVRNMKHSWGAIQRGSIWPKNREAAKNIIMAYQAVEDHIVKEMDLRAKIKESRAKK